MNKLSDNYCNRRYYLKTDQVPTFGVIQRSMKCPLAKIVLTNLTPLQKIMAGCEPPLKGGGDNWHMPPEELLKGRAVLKPIEREHLAKLGYKGIEKLSDKLFRKRANELATLRRNALEESDRIRKENIIQVCKQLWKDLSKVESGKVSEKLGLAYQEFEIMYTSSLNNLEAVIFESAKKQIKEFTEQGHADAMVKFEYLIKEQAHQLHKKYDDLLQNTKQQLKDEFIKKAEVARYNMCKQYHDIIADKHTAIEKLRHLLESRNLACQVYVALKEREEFKKEIQISKKEHLKKVKELKRTIAMQDFEVRLELEKQKKRKDFKNIWKTKICEIVKRFQKFVQYCLVDFPEQAVFFINIEKILLLQLSEAEEEPGVQIHFEIEKESHIWPVAQPHPYRLFCDRGQQLKIDSNLCPKHCTSSASQFPVVVINNKCMYAACDDFAQFTNKIKKYADGQRGDEADFKDDRVTTYDISVKQSPSNQIFELQLESSLMQVLQKERPCLEEPLICENCKSTYCFCSPLPPSRTEAICRCASSSSASSSSSTSNSKLYRYVELDHEREPQIKSYLDFIKPKKCSCHATAKEHLHEHLPPYMIRTSEFQEFELLPYERCSIQDLKNLVREAKQRGRNVITKPEPTEQEDRKVDASTQYEDVDYDELCECMSEDELNKLFKALLYAYKGAQRPSTKVVDGGITPTYLTERTASFATNRVRSLRRMVNDSDIFEVFENKDCKYY